MDWLFMKLWSDFPWYCLKNCIHDFTFFMVSSTSNIKQILPLYPSASNQNAERLITVFQSRFLSHKTDLNAKPFFRARKFLIYVCNSFFSKSLPSQIPRLQYWVFWNTGSMHKTISHSLVISSSFVSAINQKWQNLAT